MACRRQQTLTVEGRKIKIVSQVRLSKQGNFAGYNVDINGERYFSNVLERQDAVDRAYVKWVQAHA